VRADTGAGGYSDSSLRREASMGVRTPLCHHQRAISERGSQGSCSDDLSLSSWSKVHPPLRIREKGRRKTASLLPYLHLALDLEIGRLAPSARRVRGGIGQALLGFGGESPKRVLSSPMWYLPVFRCIHGVHPMICAGTARHNLVFTLHTWCHVR
jgi:hypothetical protein